MDQIPYPVPQASQPRRVRLTRIDRANSDMVSCLQIVYQVSDPYALADDDSRATGIDYIAVSLESTPGAPYFTVPREDVEPV